MRAIKDIHKISAIYETISTNYSDEDSANMRKVLSLIVDNLDNASGKDIINFICNEIQEEVTEKLVWEQIYRSIAKRKYTMNMIEEAKRAEYKANTMAIEKPLLRIDTFAGSKNQYIKIDKNRFTPIKDKWVQKGFEFVKSNYSCIGNESSKNLFHLHIPKCGGTSIRNPITHLLMYMHRMTRINSSNENIKYILHPDMPRNNYELKGLERYIDTLEHNIDGTFITAHGNPWSDIKNLLEKKYNLQQVVVTTIRDPKERLYSAIKHISHNAMNTEEIYNKIKEYQSTYDNAIDKYLHDYDLITDDYKSKEKGNQRVDIDNIIILDIDDREHVNMLKEDFLSSNMLPNILQIQRFKDSRDRERMEDRNICDEDINAVYNSCIKEGFLSKDSLINYNHMVRNGANKAESITRDKSNEYRIHPLTFIIDQENKYKLVNTNDLIASYENN